MKSISTILLALSIIGISEFIYADYFHHPKEGYVPDAKTAIKVAVAIWEPIYGAQQINEQAPYSAIFKMAYGLLKARYQDLKNILMKMEIRWGA